MKKAVMLLAVMMSAVLVSTAAFAAAWIVPVNARIVQQDNTDTTGRIYGTIQDAINSITNASATNPYVVKVMPGVYDLGTASLQMKEYVDLEGSGSDNTIIVSSNNNVDGGTCTVGTVLMANNSTIRNVKIINTAPNLNDYTAVAALVFNNVVAKAEGVSVLTGSDSVAGGQNNGVCTYGSSAHAILNNIHVEAHNNGQQSNPIQFMGGKITLTNSKLAGFGTDITLINNNYYNPENPGTVTVINSILEGTCSSCGIIGFDGGEAFDMSMSNSFINLNNGTNNAAISSALSIVMENIKITTNGSSNYYIADPSKVKIANSLLPGDLSGLAGAKLVNNHNASYNSINNQ